MIYLFTMYTAGGRLLQIFCMVKPTILVVNMFFEKRNKPSSSIVSLHVDPQYSILGYNILYSIEAFGTLNEAI